MLILLTFHDIKYSSHNRRLVESSKRMNIFDKYITYTPELLEKEFPEFIKNNSNTLSQPRGRGYWLWKPFLIYETLKRFPNDKIWYMDSGDLINRPDFKKMLLDHFNSNDICLSYSSEFISKRYTKRDCFYYMGCDEERYWNAKQVEAGSCGFKYSDNSLGFLKQWLEYCYDPRILTDMPNQCSLPNFPEFIDHRHDQSILTNMATKYDIKPNDIFRLSGSYNVP
jgi:hypothetical protein